LVGGAGDAVVFSSLIKLVGVRFAPERFAFMASASQVAGHLGGMLATAPLAIGVEVLGWRGSLVVVALMLFAIPVSALVLLKEERPAVQGVSSLHQMLSQTGALPHSPLTWGPVIIWAGAYVTSLSLLGVWGQSLLMQGHGFTHTYASMLMFAFMTSFSGGSLAIAQWRPVLDARLADLRKRFFAGSSGRELAARDIDGGTSQESRRRQGE
jgi:Major Facilitator Superfamily